MNTEQEKYIKQFSDNFPVYLNGRFKYINFLNSIPVGFFHPDFNKKIEAVEDSEISKEELKKEHDKWVKWLSFCFYQFKVKPKIEDSEGLFLIFRPKNLFEENKKILNSNKEFTTELFLEIKLLTGLTSGGNYQDNPSKENVNISYEDFKKFNFLENLLLISFPNLTLKEYSEIKENCVKFSEETVSEYYGNSQEFLNCKIDLQKLIQFVYEKNPLIIENTQEKNKKTSFKH